MIKYTNDLKHKPENQVHVNPLHARVIGIVFTMSFLDWQKDSRCFSSTVPRSVSLTPYASILRISRVIGDCNLPSHQPGGRSGVRAHWFG